MNDWETLEEENHPPRKKSIGYRLMAIVLALGLFFSSVEAYFYFIRPEPVNIPKLDEIRELLGSELRQPFSSHAPEEVKSIVAETRDQTKQIANFIASQSCRTFDRVCQSKALFYFVRDEIRYVPDDHFHDQLENPLTVLKTGGADCEDMAVLLIALQKAIGNEARLVFVPGHAYAQVRISDYKGGAWINLEATCDTCQFGALPTETGLQKKEFYEI